MSAYELDINNLPQVRTVEQLRDAMTLISGKDKPATDDDLIWFTCCQNAELLSDMNLRECASLFSDGIVAIKTLEQVQEHLNTYFEDDEQYHEESNRCLLAGVARHYNNYELSEHLLYDAD